MCESMDSAREIVYGTLNRVYDLHRCCKLFTAVTPHNVVFSYFEAPFYFLQDICY